MTIHMQERAAAGARPLPGRPAELARAAAVTLVVALALIAAGEPSPASAADAPGGAEPAAAPGAGTAAGTADARQPAAQAPAAAGKAAAIEWLEYEPGLARAREAGKPVLVSFWADWCGYCRKMKSETYTDPAVIAEVKAHFVAVSVNTTKDQRRAREYFVRGLPTIWFLDREGKRISNLPGYVDAPMFLKILRYISSGSYETMQFEEFLKKGA